MLRGLVAIAVGAVVGACGSSTPSDPVSCDPLRGPPMDRFADVTTSSGADFQYDTWDFKGGGLAVADLDGDGRPDIVASSRLGGVKVFRNLGKLHFADVTAASGVDGTLAANAIAVKDFDNDGDLDLVFAGGDTMEIYANDGTGHFQEVSRTANTGSTEQILPVDLDGDGLLDLYLVNYDTDDAAKTQNLVLMNQGGLAFGNSAVAGAGWSWTATAFDFDGDGDQDIYVANDTLLADFGDNAPAFSPQASDFFLRNDGIGPDGLPHFTDIAASLGLAQPRSSMGGVLGDFDRDGQLDLYVPNWGAKKVFLRDPTAGYHDAARDLGLLGLNRINSLCGKEPAEEDCLLMSWSAALTDFDLDGYDELIQVNGSTAIGGAPPVLLYTRGTDATFHEVAPDMACTDSRALVVTDLDGDGDQDVLMGPKVGPLLVYENRGTPAKTSWMDVRLHGHASNRDGIGALVTITMASGRKQVRVVGSGGVMNSSAPAEAFFGLGQDPVEMLEIRWPSGRVSQVATPTPGNVLVEEPTP